MRLALVAIVMLVTACGGPTRLESTTVPPTPVIPAESELPDLGNVFLLVGLSGPFAGLAERTLTAPARLVAWDDGRVVAMISNPGETPMYLSLVLNSDDVGQLRRLLLGAHLETYYDRSILAGGASCADCNATIVQTDVSGHAVEFAIRGFPIEGRQPGQTNDLPYPPGIITTMKAILGLTDRVQISGTSWTGVQPTLTISAIEIGG